MAYLLRLTPVLKGVDLVNIALTKKIVRFMQLRYRKVSKKVSFNEEEQNSMLPALLDMEKKKSKPTHRNHAKG